MKRWQKSALIFERLCFIFWNFFHRAVALPVFNVGDWILMDIPKPMIKCCRLIVLICVSVVLPFHKCLRLLRLGLYTVSTPRVDNDPPIVAHICYISLLRYNYYGEYLACEQEGFCERYIKFKGNWELLSGELLVFCWKLVSYSLTALERRSQFWSISHLVSENESIYLKTILTNSLFTNKTTSVFKCSNSGCLCCQQILLEISYTFKNVSKQYILKTRMTCDSRNLIYVVQHAKKSTFVEPELAILNSEIVQGHTGNIFDSLIMKNLK